MLLACLNRHYLSAAGCLFLFWADVVWAQIDFAHTDPPYELPGDTEKAEDTIFIPLAAPTVEWSFHKTSDNAHPNGDEQAMFWLMNRARTDPEAEGEFLAGLTQSNVTGNYSFWGVDLDKMKSELASLDPRPPGAFDRRLYEASKAHSDHMISIDEQTHDGQFDRITDSGFVRNGGAVSVFWRAQDSIHGHAALNVDWGSDGGANDGMQPGRGHRAAIMGQPFRSNVGLAMVGDDDIGTVAGPLVTSIAYCAAWPSADDHFNTFIVGTVWEDENRNGLYDPGEGLAGVTAMPNNGTYYAVTGDAGGFAIPILSDGEYLVTFSGGDLVGEEQRFATVAGESVLLIWNESDSYAPAVVGDPIRPVLSVVRGDSAIKVEWTGLPEHNYILQRGSDLTGWVDDGRTMTIDGTLYSIEIDASEIESNRFFRLKVERSAN